MFRGGFKYPNLGTIGMELQVYGLEKGNHSVYVWTIFSFNPYNRRFYDFLFGLYGVLMIVQLRVSNNSSTFNRLLTNSFPPFQAVSEHSALLSYQLVKIQCSISFLNIEKSLLLPHIQG